MDEYYEEETVNRNSFVFYDSFYRAMNYLNDEEKIQYINAIFNYSLYDRTIKMDLKIEAMFVLVKPQIDANIKKRENGKKGGRPSKDSF
jgi:hypothetical protein